MVHCYFLLLIFLKFQLYSGQQQKEDSLQNETDITKIVYTKTESTTDNILKLDVFQSKGNPLKGHRDYFLPNAYPHNEEDDLDDSLYPDYDYDKEEETIESATTKHDLEPNYIPLEVDVHLHNHKDNLPVFLLEPENSFVIKSKPATLRCRAANALEVYFKCNGIKSPTTNFEFVDPHNGVRIIEGEYNVTREEVEEYFGKDKFKCSCFAWTSRGQIRSQAVYVELAYIKKQFISSPRAELVEQYSTVTLRCEPPQAVPTPQVYWLKNGAPLALDTNVRTEGDGDLVIGQVSLQDMANYSCVAENVAGKRISEPALLTIYVNGGWSAWAPWSECTCQGRPTVGRRRARGCTDPRPLNGGHSCMGPAVQKTQDCVQCEIDIYVDIEDELPDTSQLHTGLWSPWSEWSRCDGDCLQTRRRRCVSSGACLGKDYQVSHCAMCTYHNGTPASSFWPLLMGVIVAATIFLAMVVLGIKYLKLKVHENSQYVKARTDIPPEYYGNTGLKSLPRQPDLTLHEQSENSTFLGSQRKLNSANGNNLHKEHLYEVPQLNNSYMAPVDHESRPSNSAMSDNNYCQKIYSDSEHSDSSCFVSSSSSYDRESVEISPSLKNNLSTDSELAKSADAETSETSITKVITSTGGWLQLEKCGVCVYFPEGCIDGNSKEIFWLKILKEDWNRPLLPEGMTQLSPVIKCGPQNVRFRKPLVIQFPHCAMLKNSNWIISLLEQKPSRHSKQWTQVLTLGEESNSDTLFLQVEKDKVYLMSERLSDFVIVGKSFSGFDIKLLKIAIFASEPNIGQITNYNLRVYIFEDTLCALYYCLENERNLGGQLIDNPKTMYCQDGCSDLCFNLEDIGLGWKAKPGTTYQEIPFSHVWNANLNSLHCSFSLEQTDSINSLEFKIVVYQKKCPANRQVFNVKPHEILRNLNFIPLSKQLSRSSLNKNIFVNILENPVESCYGVNPNSNDYYAKNESSVVSYDKSYKSNVDNSRIKLSRSDRRTLCILLDASTSKGNNWKMLVEKLKICKGYGYFSTKSSPTENILSLWECRSQDVGGLVELATVFRLMERNDCANIIEKYLGPNWL